MGIARCDNRRKGAIGTRVIESLMNGAIQALVDAVGWDEAFRRLQPYFEMNGRWCLKNFPLFAGTSMAGEVGTVKLVAFSLDMAYRGSRTISTTAEGASIVQRGCETCGEFTNLCEWFCRREFATMVRENDSGLAIKQIVSMDCGDNFCAWTIGRTANEGPIAIPGDTPTNYLDDERADYLCRAGCAEHWANATNALLSLLGDQRSRALLERHGRANGEGYGVYILRDPSVERGPELLRSAIDKVDAELGVSAKWVTRDGRFERTITECPLANTPDVCSQVETFWKGACDVLAPGWDVDYACRRSQGEGTCRFVVSKREQLDVLSSQL
ncbi:MAG TPA: hypothetical protein VMB46_03790 [Methanomassiliicoccales archaeon]|nr:hypothetical protein [Methanomassiliicoccales archaeon]